MSIYEDIMRSQVKMGYMGGRNGPLGYLAKKKKEKPISDDQMYGAKEKYTYTVTILNGSVYKSTDSNGLSDPFIRIKKNNVLGSTLLETPVIEKTLSPSWNYKATFVLEKRHSKGTSVIFELLDKDTIGSDKVGIAKVTLDNYGSNVKVTFNSIENGKTMINGEMYFSYTSERVDTKTSVKQGHISSSNPNYAMSM